MKANETKIDKFLATNETTFSIPVYQRNYDWTLPQCKQLFCDIIETGRNEELNAHFIGSIVYVHDDVYTTSGLTELTIIDGQQRLTTITLIYIALYRISLELNNTQLASKIHKTYLINEFADEEEKLKLKPTDNNKQALQHIININPSQEFQGYSKIIENFNYFKNSITKDNYQDVMKGLSKLVFVDIALDRHRDNPQRIFESLNSTGLELSQADLIRNYILMGLSRQDQEKIYKNFWERIEKLAKDETLNKTRVSEFIRDYLTLKNKEIPNKRDVYAKFKERFPNSSINNLENILRELETLVCFYNKLVNPSNEKDSEIRTQLEYIQRLEINVTYPFLMKVYEDYTNSTINKQVFISILKLIQSFTFRRFLLGLPTNALNKIFMALYDKVDKDNYLFSIQKALILRSGNQRFPKDAEIITALKEKDIYNIKAKNRNYLLELIENYQNKELVKIDGNPDITVEHIFPQSPDPKWKLALEAEEYKFIKENYLHTLGNLTLSGNNGKLSNKPFLDKKHMNIDGKEQGYIYSRLWLNRDLKNLEKWDKSAIENRAEMLARRAIKVWDFPEIDVEIDESSEAVNIFDADEPKSKTLDYVIFFNQKLSVSQVTKLYQEVFKKLFESDPDVFHNTEIGKRINLTADKSSLRQALPINETYFIEGNIDSNGKFDRIKQALTILEIEDELYIKYI